MYRVQYNLFVTDEDNIHSTHLNISIIKSWIKPTMLFFDSTGWYKTKHLMKLDKLSVLLERQMVNGNDSRLIKSPCCCCVNWQQLRRPYMVETSPAGRQSDARVALNAAEFLSPASEHFSTRSYSCTNSCTVTG